MSHPARGAWIEILNASSLIPAQLSRTPHGVRGLKLESNRLDPVEDEHYVTVDHPMTKTHHLSFLAYVTPDRFQLVKLYPEGPAACRFRFQRGGYLYLYCNHHGLMGRKL